MLARLLRLLKLAKITAEIRHLLLFILFDRAIGLSVDQRCVQAEISTPEAGQGHFIRRKHAGSDVLAIGAGHGLPQRCRLLIGHHKSRSECDAPFLRRLTRKRSFRAGHQGFVELP